MKRKYIVLFVVFCTFYCIWSLKGCCVCTISDFGIVGKRFSKEAWASLKFDRTGKYNPITAYNPGLYNDSIADERYSMMCDLLSNHIYKGMKKKEVEYLLGNDNHDLSSQLYGHRLVWGNVTTHNYKYSLKFEINNEYKEIELFNEKILGENGDIKKLNLLTYLGGFNPSGNDALIFIFDSNNVIVDYVYSYAI